MTAAHLRQIETQLWKGVNFTQKRIKQGKHLNKQKNSPKNASTCGFQKAKALRFLFLWVPVHALGCTQVAHRVNCPCPKRMLQARAFKSPEGRTYSPPEKPLRDFSGGGILTGVGIVCSARLCVLPDEQTNTA